SYYPLVLLVVVVVAAYGNVVNAPSARQNEEAISEIIAPNVKFAKCLIDIRQFNEDVLQLQYAARKHKLPES
ncbi:unnamed protein product, partial [Allacma fusca]